MTPCIFCGIVRGQAPATIVYEDDELLAFLDIRPITRGHTLVIPKRHATDLAELPPDTGAAMLRAGQLLAAAMRGSDLRSDGTNLVLNDGRAAFQTVGHVHLHVIPRRTGDLRGFITGLVLRRNTDPVGTGAAIRAGLRRTAGSSPITDTDRSESGEPA
ncbi:HIT family protein [Skermania piniformis]|uniref:HIT family protein n=1 Tax=Skermania pinensis TaxID=39122 RepID=A0ABX8SA40_9ACTN|nr:HIT family protein [Skermania piniformis]QXQ14714.1 HIT family protein [Skermania piniformis]